MNEITMLLSLVVSIAVSCACAVIHRNKGYSPITGFLAGFLLGFLGLLIVALEKPKNK